MKYASILLRGIALFLDTVLFCMVFFPVTYLVKGVWLMTPSDHRWIIFDPLCLVFLIIIVVYYIVCEWLFQGTAGKLILGIKIVSPEGGRISFTQSLVRNILRLVDGILCNLVGILIIIFSDNNQRLGDKVAGTYVVNIPSST